MNALEQSKELLKKFDALQRKDEECDLLNDQMDDLWWKLTPEQKEELREYSIHLYSLWSPKERYEDACRIVKSIESMIPPGPNDRTTPEARAAQLSYWVEKRDLAKVQLDELNQHNCVC